MKRIATVRTKGANLRALPKLHSQIVDQLARGDELEVFRSEAPYGEEWFYGRVDKTATGISVGVIGWIYCGDVDVKIVDDNTLLQPEPDPPAPIVPPPHESSSLPWIIVAIAASVIAALSWKLLG